MDEDVLLGMLGSLAEAEQGGGQVAPPLLSGVRHFSDPKRRKLYPEGVRFAIPSWLALLVLGAGGMAALVAFLATGAGERAVLALRTGIEETSQAKAGDPIGIVIVDLLVDSDNIKREEGGKRIRINKNGGKGGHALVKNSTTEDFNVLRKAKTKDAFGVMQWVTSSEGETIPLPAGAEHDFKAGEGGEVMIRLKV